MMDGSLPIGYRCLRSTVLRDSYSRHAIYLLFLTFICYALFHASRKPISVVKGVLHTGRFGGEKKSGWAPFDKTDWSQKIGSLEYAYLSIYAIAMVFSGYIAERVKLRYFLTIGLIGSGFANIAFGAAHYGYIHQYTYFLCIQLISGIFQSTGWPAVVTLIANWWGKKRRGLILGLWNANTSIGNILGSLIAGYYAERHWGDAFVVPGILLLLAGLMVFATLVERPEMVKLKSTARPSKSPLTGLQEFTVLRSSSEPCLVKAEPYYASTGSSGSSKQAITFWDALFIPNVVAYSVLLFFSKLVSYTFLYWLPNYLTLIEPERINAERGAQLSVLFDLGGIVGGILAGLLSDSKEEDSDSDTIWRRAVTCCVMLALAAPLLLFYVWLASATGSLSLIILFCCGSLVNGPYALITTAVSADLGTQRALQGRARALATITAIIDATGSVGAALGPLLTGILVPYGWTAVFAMLIVSDLCALVVSSWIACRTRGREVVYSLLNPAAPLRRTPFPA